MQTRIWSLNTTLRLLSQYTCVTNGNAEKVNFAGTDPGRHTLTHDYFRFSEQS